MALRSTKATALDLLIEVSACFDQACSDFQRAIYGACRVIVSLNRWDLSSEKLGGC